MVECLQCVRDPEFYSHYTNHGGSTQAYNANTSEAPHFFKPNDYIKGKFLNGMLREIPTAFLRYLEFTKNRLISSYKI